MTTRRRLLQNSLALGALGVASTDAAIAATRGKTAAAAQPEAPLREPLAAASLHKLYRRIRFGADGAAVYWWLHGTRYGLVDNVLTPFFDMHVASIHRRRDLDADRYEISSALAIYYTATGATTLLERWPNPVTGAEVKFDYPAPRVTLASYSLRDGVLAEPEAPGARSERKHFVGPARADAGRVWLDEASYIRVDRGSTPPMKVHDMYTYSVAAADLAAPLAFTPALAAFNDFNDWSPRFEMGDRPGSSISRCTGSKVATFEELPATWRALFAARHPQGFDALR